jgi:hypothetical protein
VGEELVVEWGAVAVDAVSISVPLHIDGAAKVRDQED